MIDRPALFAIAFAIAANGLGVVALADEDNVIVQLGRAFHPGTIDIARGSTLTFENQDDFIHQIYVASDSFGFDSEEKAPGENLTETFDVAGTFEVHCHIHPKMKLVVHVN